MPASNQPRTRGNDHAPVRRDDVRPTVKGSGRPLPNSEATWSASSTATRRCSIVGRATLTLVRPSERNVGLRRSALSASGASGHPHDSTDTSVAVASKCAPQASRLVVPSYGDSHADLRVHGEDVIREFDPATAVSGPAVASQILECVPRRLAFRPRIKTCSVTDLVTGGQSKRPLLRQKGPLTCGFTVAGAGFEPATSGL